MRTLIVLALAGLGAQLVDGSLGMAYGITSTTLLLAAGTNPAAASATVHLAEIGTTLASGVAHWRFRNVDWGLVAKVGLPGAVGAFAGATVLTGLATQVARPVMSGVLIALGVYVLARFTLAGLPAGNLGKPLRKRFLSPLGLVAGFVDATGGGGWGPVANSTILASGRLEPRKVIGSISTSEFAVTVAASAGFLVGLGTEGVNLAWATALLLGGAVAAPFAAWLVRHVPPRVLGSAVGGLIVLTNANTLLGSDWLGVGRATSVAVHLALFAVWAAAIAHSVRAHLRTRAAERAESAESAAVARVRVAGEPVQEPDAERKSVPTG